LTALALADIAFAAPLEESISSKAHIPASREIEDRARNSGNGQALVIDDVAIAELCSVNRDPRRELSANPSM
jgi:hypothetical protein